MANDLGHVVVIGGNGFLGHHIVAQALNRHHHRHHRQQHHDDSPAAATATATTTNTTTTTTNTTTTTAASSSASTATAAVTATAVEPPPCWSTSAVTSIDVRTGANRVPGAAYHECDITDAPRLAALLARLRPDVVIHTASPVASGESPVARDRYRRVNVDGTRAVVDACCDPAAAVKALVYTSSASVVGDGRSDLLNADERWPVVREPLQREYYSETKAAAEQIVLEANRQAPDGLLTAALRPAGIFGEGDVQTLAGLLRALAARRTDVQLGDNSNLFDFTYVGNVAHAHLLAARALVVSAAAAPRLPLDHERVDGHAFFVTNDAPCYFWDFARAVWRAAGADPRPARAWALPRPLGLGLGLVAELLSALAGSPATFTRQRAAVATMTRYFNIAKAKAVLRYEPLWSLPQGVARGVAWFLEQESGGGGAAAR